MARINNILLIDKEPKLTKQECITRVSPQIVSTKHAPEGTNPQTVEEFMKVAKQYWELGVDTKIKRPGGFNHFFYRILFSSQSKAEEVRSKLDEKRIDADLKRAMEEYKKSKYKDEVDGWDDDNNNNEGDINENQF